jgi:hypothetical protein
MKAFEALWLDTWWLWIGFFVSGIFLAFFVHPIFVSIFPISIVTFIYFAIVRYDEDGNLKNMDE